MEKCKYVRYGDVWVDMSPEEKGGFRWGEIESVDVEKLELMEKLQFSNLLIPNRVDDLELDVDNLKDELTCVKELIGDVKSSIGELKEIMTQQTRKMEDVDWRMYS
jgi:hypothetical protein